MQIKEIISLDEFNEALKTDKPLIAYFYASWEQSCRLLSSELYDLKKSVEDKVEFIKIDVDAGSEILNDFKVERIPTIVIYLNGEEEERCVGLKTKDRLASILIGYL